MNPINPVADRDGLHVVAYPGNNKVLLAMSLTDGKVAEAGWNLAGFAIWRRAAGKPEQVLSNRIAFNVAVSKNTTAKDRKWTPSDRAPFQKFRWVDVPPDGFDAPLTYRVRAQYFTGQGRTMRNGPEVTLAVPPLHQLHSKFRPHFTRGYIASQAYADRFHNKAIRPPGAKTPRFDTKPFEAQYRWLGADARTALFDFITDCEN